MLRSALNDEGRSKIVLIMHGTGVVEGGIAIDWLLEEVPLELLSKIEVYTFGSAANHFSDPYVSSPSQNTDSSTVGGL